MAVPNQRDRKGTYGVCVHVETGVEAWELGSFYLLKTSDKVLDSFLESLLGKTLFFLLFYDWMIETPSL